MMEPAGMAPPGVLNQVLQGQDLSLSGHFNWIGSGDNSGLRISRTSYFLIKILNYPALNSCVPQSA